MAVSTRTVTMFDLTYHLVDGFYDRQHLLVADLAVAIDVVQLEGPVELVLHFPSTCHAERADELLKVDLAALVGVKDVEDVVCELAGVAEGEELLVYPAELGLVEVARGAVLLEALVPGRRRSD